MKNTIIAAALLAGFTLAAQAADAPPKSPDKPEHKAHYQRPYEPVGRTAFLRLPLGTVQPDGWIKDWASLTRDGLFGHADEYPPVECGQVFAKGWTGVDLPGSKGAGPNGTNWPLEQCATWLDGTLRLGLILHDDALVEKFTKRLLFIAENMEKADKDFYTFMWWWPSNTEAPGDFDIKSNAWLGRAMAAAYEGTRDPRILKAVERAYRRHPCAHWPWALGLFGTNDEPIIDMYALSGLSSLRAVVGKSMEQSYEGHSKLRGKPGNLHD